MTPATSSPDEFRFMLEPFLEMLAEKGKILSPSDWISLVNSTKERIINAPEQCLTGVSKPSEELKMVIETIFNEQLN